MLVTGIEQAFAGLHNGAMDFEQVRKHISQNRRDQNAKNRAAGCCNAASVPAVDQAEHQKSQNRHQPQGNPHRVIPFQQAGNQNFPHQQNGHYERQNRSESRFSRKQNQKQQKQPCQNRLFVHPVMVGHGHGCDFSVAVADGHKSNISYRKQFVLLQRAVEPIYAIGFLPGELSSQNPQAASLLAGANQSGVHDIAFVCSQHLRLHPVCILISQRPFKSGRQHDKSHKQNQRQNHRQQCGILFPQR